MNPILKIFTLLALLLTPLTTQSQTLTAQQAYIKASNTGNQDYFGFSVAIQGDTAVIGAPKESSNATGVNGNQADNSAPTSGAAYVFVRNGGVWTQQAYLKPSNTGNDDQFGSVVAISGDTIVIGAWREDSAATGINGNQADNSAADSGAAYVFVRNAGVWTQQAYLKASNTGASDRFGTTLDVDGDTIVVGASNEDSNATGVGGNQADNSSQDSGAAYVFKRNTGVWTQQAYLKASNTEAYDAFGTSVAISADSVVVGAINDSSNAIGVNGDQGNNFATPSSGAAFVFTRNTGVWSQQAYLKASNTGQYDQFGYSVAVDGESIAVGAYHEASNAKGVNAPVSGGTGTQADNSANNTGAAYIFTRNTGTWSQQAYLKASNSGNNDLFGNSISLNGDSVVVGSPYESSNATGVNAPLTGGAGTQADNSATFSGTAYVFTRDTGVWTQQAYLKASNSEAIDFFGNSVSMDGITVMAGAYLEDSSTTGVNSSPDNSYGDSGAAYVFMLPIPAPSVIAISPSIGTSTGGTAVTITGTYFTGASSVTIGGAPVTNMMVTNDTTITATTPVGMDGPASVLVTTPSGTNPPNTLFTYATPDIVITHAGNILTNGQTIMVGYVAGLSPPVTFTISNPGTGGLNNLAVTKSGPDSSDFTLSNLSATSVPSGSGTATFTVTFLPSSVVMEIASLQITSNVIGGKNPFIIPLLGKTLSFTEDFDNDGLSDATEFQLAALGFDWQIPQPSLVTTFQTSAAAAGLFTASQVHALKISSPILERNPGNGSFALTFGLEKSNSLNPPAYAPFPITSPQATLQDGKLIFKFPSPENAAFFRLNAQ